MCCEPELRELNKSGANSTVGLELKGPRSWQQTMSECLATYDKPGNFRFYHRHTSFLGHDIAHVGNPQVCTDGGHRFYWSLLAIRVVGSLKDVALEFGMCVPSSCSYPVVDTVFVPYLLGRYMGKNWGPKNVEIMTRWHQDTLEVDKEDTASHFMFKVVALYPGGAAAWYQNEWPYRQKIWEYRPRWQPSKENSLILALLALPPLLATVAAKILELCGCSPGSWLRIFAIQRHLGDLSSRSSVDDLPDLHLLRLLLQFLVCWQHVILLVDWLGNSGHGGIDSFQPLTSQVAKVLGRVNHSFACLTAYLSLRSMQRALRGHQGFWRTGLVSTTWLIRRWLRQACELGFWMFFYLRLSRDIPWKPFPEFAQIWYQDRLELCSGGTFRRDGPWNDRWAEWSFLAPPMWLLSLLFLYAPTNAALKLYSPAVTVCHNMQIFENLFAVSVLAGGVGLVRHVFGRFGDFASLVAFGVLTRLGMWWQPEIIHEGFRPGHRFVGLTTAHFLPGALLCALVPSSFRAPRSVAAAMVALSLFVDWLVLPPTEVISEQPPVAVADMKLSWTQCTSFIVSNSLHALGIALFLNGMKKDSEMPSRWVLLASRLSLGINLSNIFVIHYTRGRLLLMPIEFHHIHVMGYTLWAWLMAVLVSIIVYCAVTPYALLGADRKSVV